MSKKSVLFVCMGNICRSPAGEGVFRALVEQRGLARQIDVDSAGTISYHSGEPADARMHAAAAARGYRLDGRARQFRADDFDRFDLIIAMDRDNLRNIRSLDRQGRFGDKTRLLCDFIPDSPVQDVPDPYYGGESGFAKVLDMIEQAAESILHCLFDGQTPRPAPPNL